jgi:hypothetical protein|uniref:Uncharacterized protein n=1 Tax=viral metagenome TaxID=1070528 RepID=A0A6C0E5Z1_9ZZZZ
MEVFQFYEYPRTILVVYQYNNVDKIIQYGATIHNENSLDSNNSYDREKHLSTALFRYNNNPRIIQIDLNNFTLEEREHKIRNLLCIHGCK